MEIMSEKKSYLSSEEMFYLNDFVKKKKKKEKLSVGSQVEIIYS